MPHLMGQGKHTVQSAAVIEQHIRVGSVDAPGVRAAAFSFILIDIDPAVVKAFL